MKRIISQISLVVLIMAIGMTSVLITEVNAESIAGLNVSSATEGGTFKVSFVLPSDAFAIRSVITVTYSDGSQASETLLYYTGSTDPDYVTFPAKVAGNTKITATSIDISDANRNRLEVGGTKEQTITIASKNPTPAPEPAPEPTPAPAPEPAPEPTPDTNQGENSSSNNSSNTNDNTTTTNKKEPEVVNPTFKEVNETVYAVKGCNVRSSCSTEISSNKIGGLVKGQSVKRTGIEDTWSRIEINGKTAYVATRLLTTEEPKEEKTENTVSENIVENTVSKENIIDNTPENNTIVDNEISNEQILNQIEQDIGVLPEVGQNIATKIFVFISVLSLIIIMRLQYKAKE